MVASSIDVAAEDSIRQAQSVNAETYMGVHSAQMFKDGLSFSGHERNKTWINAGGRFVDLSDVSGADSPNDARAGRRTSPAARKPGALPLDSRAAGRIMRG